jgi:hypothetical protein
MTCPRPGCDHRLVGYRDALGRAQTRPICAGGVGVYANRAPTRPITQPAPEPKLAGPSERRDVAVPCPADPLAALEVPAAPAARFPLVPIDPAGDLCAVCGKGPLPPNVRTKVCNRCCSPSTRDYREHRAARASNLGRRGKTAERSRMRWVRPVADAAEDPAATLPAGTPLPDPAQLDWLDALGFDTAAVRALVRERADHAEDAA